MSKIIKNMIRCNTCGDIIESISCHDFKYCKCGRVFVDGGHDYLRRGYTDSPEDFTELSMATEDDPYEDSSKRFG